jgi:dienelactone hydrolase
MTSIRRFMITAMSLLLLLALVACGSQAQTQPQRTTVAQSQQDITYPGVGGVTLAGTLVIPAHKQGTRVPGVVIVAGSGPTDRNGNQPGGITTDLYRQIADQLAQQGIASLRYDKRAIGRSTKLPLPKNPNQPTPEELKAMQDFVAWDNFVGDARATLNELQQQPEIDPARTALLGHSEGSVIVEQVAAMSQGLAHTPGALVLIGAPGRPIDVLLREQIAHLLKQQSPATTAFVLSKYDEIVASLRQTGKPSEGALADLRMNSAVPQGVKQLLLVLFPPYLDEYWQGELQADPASLVKHYLGPVLVLQGAKDSMVFANEDTPLLDAALKSRTPDDHQIVIVPNASHNMKFVQDPATDPGITGPVVLEFTNALRTWLTRKLSAGAV